MTNDIKLAIEKAITDKYRNLDSIFNDISKKHSNEIEKIYSDIYLEFSDNFIKRKIIGLIKNSNDLIFNFLRVCNQKKDAFSTIEVINQIPFDKEFWLIKYVHHLAHYEERNDFMLEFTNRLFKETNNIIFLKDKIEQKEAILIAIKLLYAITIYPEKILTFINDLSSIFVFPNKCLKYICDFLINNYPYICIERSDDLESTAFKTALDEATKIYLQSFEKRKSIIDTHGSTIRQERYRIMDSQRSEEMVSEAHKKSVLLSLVDNHATLFGNKSAIITQNNEKQQMSFKDFSFRIELPFQYLINPIKYEQDMNRIKKISLGDKLPC